MINQEKKAGGFRSVARGISSATLLVFLLVFVLLLFPVLTFCFLVLLASLFTWKFLPKVKRVEKANSYGNPTP
jgi:chromate transport protein ChrA